MPSQKAHITTPPSQKKVLRALDLFSGTGSVAEALRARGYEVVTVDNDKSRKADVQESILSWDYSQYPAGYFDIVAASPPCTEYSQAMTAKRPRRLRQADALVAKALEIIQRLEPRLWWIENPRWGLLRTRAVVQGLKWIHQDYCQFETKGFRKATRFWCCDEIARRPWVICNLRQCPNLDAEHLRETGRLRHMRAIGGGEHGRRPRLDEILRIPAKLIDYMCGFDASSDAQRQNDDEWQVVNSKHNRGSSQRAEQAQEARNQVREVCVRPWQVLPERPFRVGRVEHRGGGTQLLMEVDAECDGVKRTLLALVDTGAQVNLVRSDLFPRECFRPARNPLALSTVSGEALPGGRHEARLKLKFAAERPSGEPVPQGWTTSAYFHDADIGCDAILSYEWLAQERINVLPWEDSLQLHETPQWILRSASRPQQTKKAKKR